MGSLHAVNKIIHVKSLAASECSINTNYYGYMIIERTASVLLDLEIFLSGSFSISPLFRLRIHNRGGQEGEEGERISQPFFL